MSLKNPTRISFTPSLKIRPKKDLFKNIIQLPVFSRYPVIEAFQWVREGNDDVNDDGTKYILKFSTFEIRQLFESPINIPAETWQYLLYNLYILCRSKELSKNKEYDMKLENTEIILIILCVSLQNKDKFFQLIAKKIKKNITVNEKNNKKNLRKLAIDYINLINPNKEIESIKMLLSIIAYTKLYCGIVLKSINVTPSSGTNNECSNTGMSESIVEIINKIQHTTLCRSNKQIILGQLKLDKIIDNQNKYIGDCIYFLLFFGRCLNQLVVTYQDDIDINTTNKMIIIK